MLTEPPKKSDLTSPTLTPAGRSQAAARERRLAEALRLNLSRRRAQRRGRDEPPEGKPVEGKPAEV
jgi:hypothetical protein